MANDQFLESQRLMMMDMRRMESLLSSEQQRQLTGVYNHAFRFMVGSGYCPMISKYGPSLSKAMGPVDPSFLVAKNLTLIKVFNLQRVYEDHKTEKSCS